MFHFFSLLLLLNINSVYSLSIFYFFDCLQVYMVQRICQRNESPCYSTRTPKIMIIRIKAFVFDSKRLDRFLFCFITSIFIDWFTTWWILNSIKVDQFYVENNYYKVFRTFVFSGQMENQRKKSIYLNEILSYFFSFVTWANKLILLMILFQKHSYVCFIFYMFVHLTYFIFIYHDSRSFNHILVNR